MIPGVKECNKKKPFVFVSYSKEDKEIVYEIVRKLSQQGINLWIDHELNKFAGQKWSNEVHKTLSHKNCKAVLFMMSENSLTSSAVLSELVWSQESERVKRFNQKKSLTFIPVVVSDWRPSHTYAMDKWIEELKDKYFEYELFETDINILKSNEYISKAYTDDRSGEKVENQADIVGLIDFLILEKLGGNDITLLFPDSISYITKNIYNTFPNQENSNEKKLASDGIDSKAQYDETAVVQESNEPFNSRQNKMKKAAVKSSFPLNEYKEQIITFNKPAGILIGDRFTPADAWVNLYFALLQELGEKYPENFEKAVQNKEPLTEKGRVPFIASEEDKEKYFGKFYREVKDKVYAEAHGSAETLLGRTCKAAVKLGEDPANIIVYMDVPDVILPVNSVNKSGLEQETSETEHLSCEDENQVSISENSVQNSKAEDIGNGILQQFDNKELSVAELEQYRNWAQEYSQLKPNTLRMYTSSLTKLNEWIKDQNGYPGDIFLLNDLKAVEELESVLRADTNFKSWSKKQNNRFITALNSFKKYKDDLAQGIMKTESLPYEDADLESIPVNSTQNSRTVNIEDGIAQPLSSEKLSAAELEQYRNWARDYSQLQPTTLKNYIYSLNQLNGWIRDHNVYSGDILLLDDLKAVEELESVLKADTDFKSWNKKSHNRISAALNSFKMYKTAQSDSEQN